ncbi:exonuclease 1 isoform X2 [Stegostoma tigrinum]|uniref:exonuclease 1 isoform X2 n=1 Tax=Stegostoma tigrinum TaxID=3053191 RepID=UPI00286FB3EE|nr:exonuclease 1 isoform X2 [Stegostoma tigrinum]
MGIQGLLQFVKEASEPIHIKKYKGQTVALDMYCWLHKGAFACADKLAQGEQTDQYVNYCMKFVEMLDSFGVKPVLVFDGCTLPSKKEVEKARRLRRQANLQKGKQYLREGKTKEARECFARSVNITSAMAHEVIKATRMRGMDCIVAPYEADAQLAYLNKIGIAQAVITEDSDLLAFGCKKVIRKMGQYLKTTLTVTEEYIDGFIRANNTFLYQLVFDPLKRKLVPLNAYSDNVDPETLDYAGLHFGDEKALHIALGNIDISTLETRDDYNPCSFQTPAKITLGQNDKEVLKQKLPHMLSIWSKEYRPPENQLSVPKAQISPEKPCTRGKEKVINIKRLKLPSREMMAKRPREDEGLSDGALLSQYSFPSSKKQVVEKCPSPQSPLEEEQHSLVSHSIKDENPTPHHKMRNRFATILQKRNQDSGAIVIPGTRSRFFCSPKETCISSDQKTETKALSDGTERCKNLNSISCFNSEENDIFTNIKKNECELLNTSPKANTAHSDLNLVARKNISAFSWSGDLGEKPRKPNPAAGLSVLQQFCRKVESSPVSGYIDRKVQSNQSATENKPSLLELCEQSIDDDSDMMASPQSPLGVSSSLDSSYSGFDSLSSSQMSRNSDLDETSNKATSCDQVCSPVTLPELPEKVTVTVKHRVPGLQKLSPGSLRMASKLKLPGPAKASGLNKRSLSLQKRTFASNNENTPELQATIQDLWQKFGFKGEPRKLQSSQKSHPMSPVKDNLQILTPETDQSILLKSECSVQRAIQW